MHKKRKEDPQEFDELDELEIQPMTDEDLEAVGAGAEGDAQYCSLFSCSCF